MGLFLKYLILVDKNEQTRWFWADFRTNHGDQFKHDLAVGSEEDAEDLGRFLLKCLQSGTNKDAMFFIGAIVKDRRIIPWDKHTELVTHIFDSIMKNGIVGQPENFVQEFSEMLRKRKFLHIHGESIIFFLNFTYKSDNYCLYQSTSEFYEALPWLKYPEATSEFLQISYKQYKKFPDLKNNSPQANYTRRVWMGIFDGCGKRVVRFKDDATNMFLFCKQHWWDSGGKPYTDTAHHDWLEMALRDYISPNVNNKELIQPVFKACVDMKETKDKHILRGVNNLLQRMEGSLLAELDSEGILVDEKIRGYLSGEDYSLIRTLKSMYSTIPQRLNSHLDDIAATAAFADGSSVMDFFNTVFNEHPEEVTDKHVVHLMGAVEEDPHTIRGFLPLAQKRPKMLMPHEDYIIERLLANDDTGPSILPLLDHLASAFPDRVEKYLDALTKVICKVNPMFKVSYLYYMRTIGQKQIPSLKKFVPFLQELKKDPTLSEHVGFIMNIIDGRSLEAVSNDVKGVKHNVTELGERVTNTEENVSNLAMEVDINKAEGGHVSGELKQETKHLKEQDDVAEDKKQPSHAPLWSPDVSKLLNPKSKRDWKNLATRLGFGEDSIRDWATQPDPCMDMLNELFATQKSKNATQTVLKHLQEMGREDAYSVVESYGEQEALQSKRPEHKHSPHHPDIQELQKMLDDKLLQHRAEIVRDIETVIDKKLKDFEQRIDFKLQTLLEERTVPSAPSESGNTGDSESKSSQKYFLYQI